MQRINIRDFSCIKKATFEISPLTILIGPQASGKSVITKLLYFCNDILLSQYDWAEDGDGPLKFAKHLEGKFKDWFPVSAWGQGAFEISFIVSDEIEYSFSRRKSARKVYDEVDVKLSSGFQKQYQELVKRYNAAKKSGPTDDDDDGVFRNFDKAWRVRGTSLRSLIERLGLEFVSSQTYIPAGRSFFTNLGKAVAMLEHGNQLDEITREFGRLFTSLLDGDRFYYGEKPTQKGKDFLAHQKNLFENLFEGSVRITHNDRHVDTRDGRRIPFSILSSGQQELLPLLLILSHAARQQANSQRNSAEMIYVEEPEAHLFPSAQGALIEYIASMSAFFGKRMQFLITTHSPYVIAKFNNLIKAHTVSMLSGGKLEKRVSQIIDRRSWLAPASVGAYALDDGVLRSVKGPGGLIDGEYLDAISEDLGDRFLALLEVETEYDPKPVLPTEQQIKNEDRGKR